MEGWIDGGMDRWMDGTMDRWIDGWIDGLIQYYDLEMGGTNYTHHFYGFDWDGLKWPESDVDVLYKYVYSRYLDGLEI